MKMVLIKCNMYKIWSVIVCVLFILKEAGCYHISVQSKCEDVYIWYGDGSVACEYLITPSNYGLHKRPRYFCTQYPLTRCCETCAFLRRHEYKVTNGVNHPSGFTSLPTTPQKTDRMLFIPTSRQEITTQSVPRTEPVTTSVQSKCEDVHIWYGDGRVDCKYLITPSNFGVHKRARYFCTEYPMTKCCDTCALLRRHEYKVNNGVYHPFGSTSLPTTPQKTDRILFTVPTSRQEITTKSVPRTKPVTTSVQSKCEDVHIWYGDGRVDCKYLITPSNFGVHKRARYFCTEYPMTHCCETCALLRRHEYKVTNGVHHPSGSTSLPTTPKKPDRILFTVPTSRQEITTQSVPRTKPVTTSAQPACEDTYIWLFDGRVDCQFLVTPTVYGLHTNQKFYCVEYPFTRCCNTCAYLKTHNYNYINGIDNPTTTELSTTTVTVPTQPTNLDQTFNTMQQTMGNQEKVPNNLMSPNVVETVPSAAAFMHQPTATLDRHITQPEITTELPTNIHRTIKMFFNALVTMQTQNPHHMLHGARHSKITSQTPTQTTTVKSTTLITTTTTPVPTTTSTPAPTTTTTTPVPTTTTTTPVPTTTTTTPVPTTTTTTPVPTTTTTTPVPTTTTTTPVPTTTTTTPVPTTTTTTPVPTTTTTTPVPTTTTTTPVPTTTTTTPVPTTTTTTPVPTTKKAPAPSTKRVTVTKPKVVARPDCVDVGIWIISGSVGCEYLETDNKYGLNKNQMYFCLRYPLTSCCETCGRIIRSQGTNLRKQP